MRPAVGVAALAELHGGEHLAATARAAELRAQRHLARATLRSLESEPAPADPEEGVKALLAGRPLPSPAPRATPQEIEAARERLALVAEATTRAEGLVSAAQAKVAERVAGEVRGEHLERVRRLAQAGVNAMTELESLTDFQAELDRAVPGWERHLARVAFPPLATDPKSPAAGWLRALAGSGLLDPGSIPSNWREKWRMT